MTSSGDDAADAEASGYIPKVYGRAQGKRLRARQANLVDELLPRIAVFAGEPAADGPIDLSRLFPGKSDFQLEIGFGGGEHLAWQAAKKPETGFIGAEPFINGVAKLLAQVDAEDLDNIRIHHGDGRNVMERLPAASLSRVYVLHPDPWPKKRHFKRRMISPWFFKEAARLLIPGGVLRVASDIPDYIRWTLMHYQAHNQRSRDFGWTAETSADWRIRPDDWPQTRYEAKAIREGRPPAYLAFERRTDRR